MARWRIALHALDRTGPPRLARSFAEWVSVHRPDVEFDVVAFRGGVLEPEFTAMCPVSVLLDDGEAWDHAAPDADRVAEVRRSISTLEPVDLVLLVSVSAGQVLDHLPDRQPAEHPDGAAPVVAWVVEQGEDLHWLDGPLSLRDRVDVWLAGSDGTRDELLTRLEPGTPVGLAHEFVDGPGPSHGDAPHGRPGGIAPMLVIGAGIGTHRKAPDLFLEVALAFTRSGTVPARFVWIGGETDPLIPLVRREIERLDLVELELVDNTPDLDAWLRAADVLVHPARLDAFPLVCLEAALRGTPVLAFDGVGGVPEMFGPTFLGVPYPDVAGLVALLDELAASSALVEVGRRQRDHVRERYVTDVAAPVLVEHLVAATRTSSRSGA